MTTHTLDKHTIPIAKEDQALKVDPMLLLEQLVLLHDTGGQQREGELISVDHDLLLVVPGDKGPLTTYKCEIKIDSSPLSPQKLPKIAIKFSAHWKICM